MSDPCFRRFQTLPKRYWQIVEANPRRAEYIRLQSKARYDLTDDGKYFSVCVKNMKPEIGMIESFRFICSAPVEFTRISHDELYGDVDD